MSLSPAKIESGFFIVIPDSALIPVVIESARIPVVIESFLNPISGDFFSDLFTELGDSVVPAITKSS